MANATSSGSAADDDLAALATLLRDGGEDVVILWGERLDPAAQGSLLAIARALGLDGRDGAGLIEVPTVSQRPRAARGRHRSRTSARATAPSTAAGRNAAQIAQAAADGEITALYLLETDPVRELPDRAAWERALSRAGLVIAHASVLTEGLAEHATVIFPAESSAEKEGTVVHPDGRIQRLHAAIAHPGRGSRRLVGDRRDRQARRPRPRRAHLVDGLPQARGGGPVL